MLALLLVLAADPADLEPLPAPVATPQRFVRPDESVFAALEATEENADTDHEALVVGGLSAIGGGIGFASAAGLGLVVGTFATLARGSAAGGVVFLGTLAAMPLGAGLGAGLAHATVHSEGAVNAATLASSGRSAAERSGRPSASPARSRPAQAQHGASSTRSRGVSSAPAPARSSARPWAPRSTPSSSSRLRAVDAVVPLA